MSVAVVGAGIAGLAAAEVLVAGGRVVRLFDKGRGAGGRMATRRAPVGDQEASFDHGAQYFTARSQAFRLRTIRWLQDGLVAEWSPRRRGDHSDESWFVGRPGMNAVLRGMADELDVSWSARVAGITGEARHWWLQMEDGLEEGPFSQLVVAVPAEQAANMLQDVAPALATRARRVASLPCWSAMLAYAQPQGLPLDLIETGDAASPIAWAACNSSKPGRVGPEAWVVQAGAEWSAEHIEQAPEWVAEQLVAAFCDAAGARRPDYTSAHRWRFARVSEPLGEPCLIEADLGIATCGDWHLGARIEAAWLSGHQLGEDLLR